MSPVLDNELNTPIFIDLENPNLNHDFRDDDGDDDDVSFDESRHKSTSSIPDLNILFSSQKPLPTPYYINPLAILKSVSDEYTTTARTKLMRVLNDMIYKHTEPFHIWLSY